MENNSIITNQMRYDYSSKLVFNLYMAKLITSDEYQIIIGKLKEQYNIEN